MMHPDRVPISQQAVSTTSILSIGRGHWTLDVVLNWIANGNDNGIVEQKGVFAIIMAKMSSKKEKHCGRFKGQIGGAKIWN
ncbi:hypothetical protein BLOT_013095 [Blomia tropicalis]|nr:hypothetical protein BLOT_013095 [Blomia tropicalis]